MSRQCYCGAQPHCAYDVTVVFHRIIGTTPHFYPVVGTACENWAEHAALNPGTLHIDTLHGERLWPESAVQ